MTFGIESQRFGIEFNPDLLIEDLNKIQEEEWIMHYRSDHYVGHWAAAPLRSVGGHPSVVHASPSGGNPDFYQNTPLLNRCGYFKQVLEWFKCEINACRLLMLGPGSKILEHTDAMALEGTEEWRIHVPITTNGRVEFVLNKNQLNMLPGEIWFADFNLPHLVNNNGDSNRIHLVLDCTPNDWLTEQVQKAFFVDKISVFLNKIGISILKGNLDSNTFLPGILIKNGGLVIDMEKLKYPGDILHEAGHIAVTEKEKRKLLNANVGEEETNAMGDEIASILWSYAALKEIGLPEEVVFHEDGYKGQSDWLIENFKKGIYPGMPLFKWMGFINTDPGNSHPSGFPKMEKWLR
jgi:hypothetical protein